MIGVVIWSSEESQKAVIWCEDQGPLAYLRGHDCLSDGADWPVPGDLLRIECEIIGNLRHARSVSVIAPKVCPQLPDALLGKTNRPGSHLQIVHRNDALPPIFESEEDESAFLSSAINS
ncbi:MAG: hypothetical protein Q4G26_14880 [Paracoccus sp. (in: a-proteobacteria)]|nr:hypothetical protein [Paracoccus sp. (in: a-proteobacteria)]